jgi:two-component system, NarL family, invasion response regulator UvrY
MESQIKVLIADNQPLTSAGLRHILDGKPDVFIVDHVMSGDRLFALVKQHQPDLVIADYDSPGYISKDDLAAIKNYSPKTNVLVVSSDNNKESILQVLQSGVIGYVTKQCSHNEVLAAVYSVAKGEKFYCHKILDIIMEKHFHPESTVAIERNLTARETEILTLLASGYSTKKLANQLHLSPHTIHTHRKSIIKKLKIKSPTEYVIHAIELGLIKSR